MKSILFVLIFLTLISGCIIGSNDLAQEEFSKINQTQLEQKLTKNTSLESQNITVASSILVTAENILKLKQELDRLEQNIESINQEIEILKLNSTSQESAEFLNYLNQLTLTSMQFTNSLRDSVETWDLILSKANTNISSR